MTAVNSNMFDASVRTDQRAGATMILALPLNLIAHIVSYIEEPGDLARICRTCRLFNYMALPHLYRNISLTSYERIRYRNEQPEGWGSASPFLMGLNCIVTKPQASFIYSLTLRGDWKEPELEEHSRVGRVPDSAMVLNIAVRAAIDRATDMKEFNWELNTKLLETAYLGLSQLPKLTSLSIRFPTSRHPRPIYVIPAMPYLRTFKVTDIDPLCYPDDISTLLAKSRRLRNLTMHWSPRMRELQEPSVVAHDYFRESISSNSPMKLKKVAFYNFYARNTFDMSQAFDEGYLEEMTTLNNSYAEDSYLSFVDRTWLLAKPPSNSTWKSVRHDNITKEFCEFLSTLTNLERLYFVNPSRGLAETIQSPRQSSAATPTIHMANGTNPNSAMAALARTGSPSSSPRSPSTNASPLIQLRDTYLLPILTNTGATLRHLLLPTRWPLSSTLIARIVRDCPNLEQLAFAPEISALDAFQLLSPFLRKLVAMRILFSPAEKSAIIPTQNVSNDDNSPALILTLSELAALDERLHLEKVSTILADKQIHSKMQIVGLGTKGILLEDFYHIPADETTPDALGVNPEDYRREPMSGPMSGPMLYPVASNAGAPTNGRSSRSMQPPRSSNNHTPSSSLAPPRSALGKRPREEATPPRSAAESPREFTLVLESDNVYETLPSGERIAWRRRVRLADPEVLKKWEIFALDSQDFEPS
ncbi:hypothetical protein BGW36DRAFT_353712 [Talaromyces proteolyticus]|uniref:F-box domain-containing protein n=1 Tax=Talaromyces proteolyticus TaxID=1131652 RepID=A0AAD4L7B9_9EURO|nr:uncharacterized protein BGW36DRAFT_353712 [Talaromyces proteolyticus]KAH8705304.1 hypothetical protein BGW36DRAFT_353712 [Talaromyces proteolyticus]